MILLLTDLHFGLNKFSQIKYKITIDYLHKIVFPYILDNKIKSVIHLGDIIHDEMKIDNAMLLDIQNDFIQFFIDNDINLYLLTGNHDIYFKDELNRKKYNFNEILAKYHKNITAISETFCQEIDGINFSFVPFASQFQKYDVDYYLGHHDVADMDMGLGNISKHGLSKSELIKLSKPILMGHYHNRSSYSNINYLGTLFQHNLGEYGYRKGFNVITDDKEIVFIENTLSPKHIKVKYIQDTKSKKPYCIVNDGINKLNNYPVDSEELKLIIQNNFIKFETDEYYSETKYQEVISEFKSISAYPLIINNNKKLNNEIDKLLSIEENEDKDIPQDGDVNELCRYFFNKIENDNKEAIIELFKSKMNKFRGL